MFFVIYPIESADWQHAMFMLSFYNKIKISTYSNGDDADTAYMVVEEVVIPEGEESELRLAEMAFQMNWHQHPVSLCPHCIDHSDHFDRCGHLAFSKPINPAF